jgi:hypothetical protein
MIGYCTIAFIVGGIFGMMGMAMLAYGSKVNLIQEIKVLRKRLNFLENEDPRQKYQSVKDPRPDVHKMVN